MFFYFYQILNTFSKLKIMSECYLSFYYKYKVYYCYLPFYYKYKVYYFLFSR